LLIGNLHKLWKKKFFDATFAFSAGTAAGQFQALMDGLKIYLI